MGKVNSSVLERRKMATLKIKPKSRKIKFLLKQFRDFKKREREKLRWQL